MSENFILSTLGFQDSSSAAKNEILELQAIDARLLAHQTSRNQQGLIARGIDSVLSIVWHSDEDSEKSLQTLRAEVVAAQHSGDPTAAGKLDARINEAVQNDVQAVRGNSFKTGTSNFVADAAVAAPLFVRGSRGRSLSALVNGVNDIAPEDGAAGATTDAAMGAAKGFALSWTYEHMGRTNLSLGAKGALLGAINRSQTTLLSARSYRDQDGTFSLSQGLTATAQTTFNPCALATDVAGGLASKRLSNAIDGRFDGILSKSPLAANIFTGGTIGLVSGASGELQNETTTGQFDARNVLAASLRGAGSSAISGALGRGLERTTPFAPIDPVSGLRTPAKNSIMLLHPDVLAPNMTPESVVATSENASGNQSTGEPEHVPTAAELAPPVPARPLSPELLARPIASVQRPETDIAIIGNGIFGMSLANRLAQGRFSMGNGILRPRITVLSANDLAQEGNSIQMTGMATRAIDGSYTEFRDSLGPENYARFIEDVRTGQVRIQDLAKAVGVLNPSNSYYFAYEPNNEYLHDGLKPLAEADPRNSYILGDAARRVQPWMAEAIRLTEEGNVDPTSLLTGIARQKIFNDRVQMLRGMVTGIQTDDHGVTIDTADGSSLRAGKVIFATNMPPAFLGDYSAISEPWEGLTIHAHAPDHNLGPHNYFDTETIAFFRALGKDTVSIGGDADTGVPLTVMNRLFPNARIINATAATLPISVDQRPVFDRFPGMHNRVYYAGLGSGTGLVFSGVGTEIMPGLLNDEAHPAPDVWGLNRFDGESHIATGPTGH